jgi:hypothetical protein
MSSSITTAVNTAPGSYVYTNSSAPMSISPDGIVRAKHGVVSQDNEVTMGDLLSDVFRAKVETLVDLWITRYGNEWVDLANVMEDEFYGRVYKRLRSLGELEVHFLTDRAKYVCRKPE